MATPIVGKCLKITRIKDRKTSYLSHIMRSQKYHLLQLTLQREVEASPGNDRKESFCLRIRRQGTDMSSVKQLLTAVRDSNERAFCNY